jgi:two-component system, NtrC family, response regulator GlrR
VANMKVLTIEFGGGELAESVHNILTSSHDNFSFDVHRSRYGDPATSIKEIGILISSYNPAIVLLLVVSDYLLHSRLYLKTLTKPVIVVCDSCDTSEMMEILRLGAADFITAPVRDQDLIPRMWHLTAQKKDDFRLTESLKERLGLENLIGQNVSFLLEVKKIRVVARCDVSVLITGETGTGKELFARAIHYLSPRSGRPFVAVNCGSIPAELAENELFGHVRGAYTGADSSVQGLISEADGGTLFLDDVDCLPLSIQVKLLRFLQEKEYRRLGSSKNISADVRVLASSNGDLMKAVEERNFRKDLYYRLNVVLFRLPPLRERLDDIPLLANHFLKKYAHEFGKDIQLVSERAISQLADHNWIGNVRELENVIERAIVFASGPVIDDIQISQGGQMRVLPINHSISLKEAKAKAIEEFEKDYIERLLSANGGNIARAARAAQKNRRAFFELMRKHNIVAPSRSADHAEADTGRL